jgi:transposase
MKRFVEGEDRRQGVLLPEYLDDFVSEENQVRVIEAFVEPEFRRQMIDLVRSGRTPEGDFQH